MVTAASVHDRAAFELRHTAHNEATNFTTMLAAQEYARYFTLSMFAPVLTLASLSFNTFSIARASLPSGNNVGRPKNSLFNIG